MTSRCFRSPSYREPPSYTHNCPLGSSPNNDKTQTIRHNIDPSRFCDHPTELEIANLSSSTESSSCLDELIQRTYRLVQQMERKMVQQREQILCQERSAMGDNNCQNCSDVEKDLLLTEITSKATDYYRGMIKDKWHTRRSLLGKTEKDMDSSFDRVLYLIRQMEQRDEFSNIREELQNLRAQVKVLSVASERFGASNSECKFITDMEPIIQCIECINRQYERTVCELSKMRVANSEKTRCPEENATNLPSTSARGRSPYQRTSVCELMGDECNGGICPLKTPPSSTPSPAPTPAPPPPVPSPTVPPTHPCPVQVPYQHSCYFCNSCPHGYPSAPFIPICIPCPSMNCLNLSSSPEQIGNENVTVCPFPRTSTPKKNKSAVRICNQRNYENNGITISNIEPDTCDEDLYTARLAPCEMPISRPPNPNICCSTQTDSDKRGEVPVCEDLDEEKKRFDLGLKLLTAALILFLFCHFYAWLKSTHPNSPQESSVCDEHEGPCFPWCSVLDSIFL